MSSPVRVAPLLLVLFLASVGAAARSGEEPEENPDEAPAQSVTVTERRPQAPRNFGNFRAGGGSSSANGHPDLCLELAPFSFLAIEGCGTGSGFLHEDKDPETAHFRAKLNGRAWTYREGFLVPHLGLGFAELQVAEDSPGFDFRGTGPDGVETAGPEAGAGLRLLYPLSGLAEIVGDAALSYAYLPHAPELLRPHSKDHWTASVTLGIGF
jgi:hypothetical protein